VFHINLLPLSSWYTNIYVSSALYGITSQRLWIFNITVIVNCKYVGSYTLVFTQPGIHQGLRFPLWSSSLFQKVKQCCLTICYAVCGTYTGTTSKGQHVQEESTSTSWLLMMRPVCCPQKVNKILQTFTIHNPLRVKTGIQSQLKLHCTTLILPSQWKLVILLYF